MPTPTVEPVSLELIKQHLRVTSTSEDALISLYISAARRKAEAFCNCCFVSQEVTKTYAINQVCPIPAADIINVGGFYSTPEEVAGAYDYFVEYQKGISVNRQYPLDMANLPTYTVTYRVEVDPADVPENVQVAIMKLAADLYENRENYGGNEMGITYKSMLMPHKKFA